MIDDIIFDWDGTLVDTLPFLKETFDKTFEHLGRKTMSYAEIRRVIHENQGGDLFHSVFGARDFFQAKRFFHTYTLRHHLQNLSPLPGAEDILGFCRGQGIRCHIFSNKRGSILRSEVSGLGWEKYFSRICGAGDCAEDKPSPEACCAFWHHETPPKDRILVVGDGPADTEAARFWNCPVVIIDEKKAYIGAEPDYKLQKLMDFIPLLQTMLY